MNLRSIIVILFLSISFLAFSQNTALPDISKQEAEQFIKDKLKEHSYVNPKVGIKNNYDILFTDSSMTILNPKGVCNYSTIIKKNDIDSISIEETDYNVWLTVTLVKGKKEKIVKDDTPIGLPHGYYFFVLDKSFIKNNIPVLIGEAFRKIAN